MLNMHHRRSPAPAQPATDEGGFTLVEVVIAIVLLGILLLPLAFGFRVSVTTSITATEVLDSAVARQQLASVWADDVANVDATGYNTSTSGVCRVSASNPGGTPILNLNSTEATPTGPVTTRVTYFRRSSGSTTELVRVRCTGITPATYSSARNGGRRETLARSVGRRGLTAAQVFSGAVPRPASTVRVPCDETRCALRVHGRFTFTVSAQRRVFGAGVPVEAGKVHSSTSNVYPLMNAMGQPTGQELAWGGRLTLAPGLESSASLRVEVAIQQAVADAPPNGRSTGRFYNAASTAVDRFDITPPSSPTAVFPPNATWTQMTYNDPAAPNVWSFALPTSLLTRGGEYRIWTRLRPLPLSATTTKQYGGVTGFPLWIDWKPSDVIWVSSASTVAAPTGLLPGSAFKTLDAGVLASLSQARPQVLVVDNLADYAPLTLANVSNRVITGGINPTTYLRVAPQVPTGTLAAPTGTDRYTGLSTLRGAAAATQDNTGLVVNAGTNLTLRHMYIEGGVPTGAHKSSYGVRVLGGATTFLERTFVRARDGAAGANGTDGANGANACWGRNGSDSTSTNNAWDQAPAVNGPAEGCSPAQTTRYGGYGGAGGGQGLSGGNGQNGQVGGGGSATGGTAGGGGAGAGCFSGGQNATSGGGVPGAAVTAGVGTNPSTVAATWAGGDGKDGLDGAPGLGGGGGGGGGGNCYGNGGSGGAGGQGGAGGGKGTGGKAGGASFGLYVFGAGKATVRTGSRVEATNGGAGGVGGRGGLGGAGGRGGTGYAKSWDGGGESAGGGGGGGGAGGSSGAGGEGGWSVGAFADQAGGVVVDTGATVRRGTNGTGGAAGVVQNHPGLPGNSQYPGAPASTGNGGPGGPGGPPSTSSLSIFGWTFYSTKGQAGANGSVGPAAGASTAGSPGLQCTTRIAGTCS